MTFYERLMKEKEQLRKEKEQLRDRDMILLRQQPLPPVTRLSAPTAAGGELSFVCLSRKFILLETIFSPRRATSFAMVLPPFDSQ